MGVQNQQCVAQATKSVLMALKKKQTNQLGFAQLQIRICNDPSGEKN
jgi:hypothetical protein